mmetsp:Transcript_121604/g.192493  ORF Transcript_121604/g.192493 Transcript_121604/m.192493 type:complete len:871 (+) Transcript_121604:174-2786(+)
MPSSKSRGANDGLGCRICPRSFAWRVVICVAIPCCIIMINVAINSYDSTFAMDTYSGEMSPDSQSKKTKVHKEASDEERKNKAPAADLHLELKRNSSSLVDALSTPVRRAARSAKVEKKSDSVFVIEDGALSFQVDLGTREELREGIVHNAGEDCWGGSKCSHAGACAWCGVGNACCKFGFASDPPECRTVTNWASKKHHECVAISRAVYKHAKATLSINGETVLSTPISGMWSVGRDLRQGWPSIWDVGGIDDVQIEGPWLAVEGSVSTPQGDWQVKDRWRIYDGVVEGLRDWTFLGATEKRSNDTVLSIAWEAIDAHGLGLVMPAVVYHGNPSGGRHLRSNSAVVHVWRSQPSFKLQVEEHRLSQTWASFEWTSRSGHQVVVALDSQPSAPPYARHFDVQWSLGAEKTKNGTTLQLLSGSVAFNNEAGYVKSGQNKMTPFMNVGLAVPSGHKVQKQYRLHASRIQQKGGGFRVPLDWTITRGDLSADSLPRFPDIVDAKVRFALSRWCEEKKYPGFAMYPNNRNVFVMGWAGQAEAPGYALPVLADRLGKPELRKIGYKALDVLSQATFDRGGFKLKVEGDSGQWSQQDPVSQGQAMSAFARAIRYGRQTGAEVADWEAFLTKACDIHSRRILQGNWHPRSTAEAFLIQPLALGSKIFDNPTYLKAALKAGDHYASRHIGEREPFWGGTLDASAEDKEGAWAGFEAFLALYEVTTDSRWLDAANYAADFTLTYTYMWDMNLPPGRLRDHNLKTRGWTAVSVQNMHLDVYGVLYTPRLWRLGQLSNRPELFRIAELMYRSCGQMIDARGSQGEQLQQTRFAQAGDMSNPERYRGGYVEGWTVFWIAAHFLTAAALFEEMGVLSQLWERL